MTHPVLLTIDLDRDWPIEKIGRMEARSGMEDDTPDMPVIRATQQGVEVILDILEKWGLRATFFIEASVLKHLPEEHIQRLSKHDIGCHGYAHEDFTGVGSEYKPSKAEVVEVIKKARTIIETRLRMPRGFRAPYLRSNGIIRTVVREQGFQYDSSETVKQASALSPYLTGEDIQEVPLSTGLDRNGRVISGYLWQLHEGRRKVADYLHLIDTQATNKDIKYSMIATHPWHLFLSTITKKYTEGEVLRKNHERFTELIESISDKIMSIADFLNLE